MKLSYKLVALTLLASPSVFAAKFSSLSQFKSPTVQALAEIGQQAASNSQVFGDASEVIAVSVQRKSTEQDINTVKQLNISNRVGDYQDNDGTDVKDQTPEQIVDTLMMAMSNTDSDSAPEMLKARSDMASVIAEIKKDPSLKMYTAGHGDDDGSWSGLDVLDTANNELLVIKIGFTGN
jgi:hypothetical protein